MPGRRKFSPQSSSSGAAAPWVVVTPRAVATPELVPPLAALIDSPRRLASQFSAADLPGQFVLSRSEDAVPSGWAVRRHRGWILGAHPWLPVTTMRTLDGAEAGWLLGQPITEDAQFIEDVVELPFDLNVPPAEIEAWLSRLGGRFLAVWLTPRFERVYLDAGGLLSAVYAREHDLVASTTSLVPYSRGCDDDMDLLRASRMPHGRAVLSFGMTSRRGVQRLHPNHYLDLLNWAPRRHWPAEPLDECIDPDEAIHIVSRVIERHIVAATRRGPLEMALTAGHDSRMILACAREHFDNVNLFTIAIPDRTGRRDVDLATRIARRHGLPHHTLPFLSPSQTDLDAWLWRTGSAVSELRGWRASRTYGGRGDSITPEITGAGGEAARVAYWRDSGSGHYAITPGVLLDCLNQPHSPGIMASARSWMKWYPASTPVQLLDGFYIEQALGVTAGTLAYGDAGYVRNRVYPFVNREALDAMSRLPEAYKLARRFPQDLIRHNWPELLRTPFNRRPGVGNYVDKARRRAWFMRRALAGALSSR